MKVTFTQIYSEPEAHFDIPGPLLRNVREAIDGLNKSIDALSNKFGGGEFELVLIISASSKLDSLRVVGPNIRRRAREAEFSLFMPWRTTSGFVPMAEYVLALIGQGLCEVFRRYGIADDGVDETLRALIERVRANPTHFQYPPR